MFVFLQVKNTFLNPTSKPFLEAEMTSLKH